MTPTIHLLLNRPGCPKVRSKASSTQEKKCPEVGDVESAGRVNNIDNAEPLTLTAGLRPVRRARQLMRGSDRASVRRRYEFVHQLRAESTRAAADGDVRCARSPTAVAPPRYTVDAAAAERLLMLAARRHLRSADSRSLVLSPTAVVTLRSPVQLSGAIC